MTQETKQAAYSVLTEDELLTLGYRIPLPDLKQYYWEYGDSEGSEDFPSKEEAIKAASKDAFNTFDLHCCDSCGKIHVEDGMNAIDDFLTRTDPGEGVVPSGQCTECGTLCYPIKPDYNGDDTMTDKGYVASAANLCPFCGSDDIEGGEFNADGTSAWCDVICNDCGKSWQDHYQLVGYSETNV